MSAPEAAALAPTARPGRRRRRIDLLLWFCGAWLAVLILAAITAPMLGLQEAQDAAKTLLEPVYQPPSLGSTHPLGTNALGLDMLSRIIYGARVSLTVSISAVLIGTFVGGTLGVIAGYLRGKVDRVIGTLTNTLLAVPALILLVALATVLRPSALNMALALSLVAIPGLIRVTRANTLAFAQREFVTVARALGAGRARVVFRELMPNVLLSVVPMCLVYVSALIVAEASLSFLGIGLRPPQPTWGNMIGEGLNGKMEDYPHLVYVPAAVLFLTVFSFNLLGERMRKRWDKREVSL
ncbi:ABC transporter permease [Microbispora rosea]|uniref:ABC transporter permease n=1 Tax=Microbispora rosea TaxID=58117 RepID=UPI0034494AC7